MIIKSAILWLLSLYLLIMFVWAVMGWFPLGYDSPAFKIREALGKLIEPALRPLRRVLPPVEMGNMAIDLAFIVLFFIVIILQSIIGAI